MKVAVLGASSLIGSHIYGNLATSGYELIGTSHTRGRGNFISLDLSKERQLEEFVQKHHPQILVNSVGVVGKEACSRNADLAKRLNTTVVQEMAELCREKNIKLVHLSTVAVHDGKKHGAYTEHDAPTLISGNLYNITKVAAEGLAEKAFNHCIVRIGDTFGNAYQRPTSMGGSVFKWAYDKLKTGQEVPAFKGLRTNQTYLPDIGQAVTFLIGCDYQGIINVGGDAIEVADFFEQIRSTFNLPGSIARIDHPADYQGNRELDTHLMRSLGINTTSIDKGLAKLALHYRID